MLALEQIETLVRDVQPLIARVRAEVARSIVGQRSMIDGLLIGLLTDGHVLLEGVPGLAKTSAVKALASSLSAQFSRIQFTPDLLPADLIGTQVYSPRDGSFSIRKGPIFANIVLADEINRAPAKVQSALLEAMQERQVTIGDTSFALPSPFLVLATQNPIEQEGTYPLPEAQVDRFMLKLKVGYPSRDEEREIMKRSGQEPVHHQAVVSLEEIERLKGVVRSIHMEPVIEAYIVDIVRATRAPASFGLADLAPLIEFGASPRASIALSAAARARAFLDGRAWVKPDDVKAAGADVLRHRVLLSYEAEAQELAADQLIRRFFDQIPTP